MAEGGSEETITSPILTLTLPGDSGLQQRTAAECLPVSTSESLFEDTGGSSASLATDKGDNSPGMKTDDNRELLALVIEQQNQDPVELYEDADEDMQLYCHRLAALDSPDGDDERSSLYSGVSEDLAIKVTDLLRRNGDLEFALKKGAEEKEELKSEMSVLMHSNAESEKECKKLRDEIERASKKVSALDGRIVELSNELKDARESGESMVLQYAQSEKELLLLGQSKDFVEKKLKEVLRDKETLVGRLRIFTEDKARLSKNLDARCTEVIQLTRDLDKSREEVASRDIKIKWIQNKVLEEMEAHKETQTELKKALSELKTYKTHESDKAREREETENKLKVKDEGTEVEKSLEELNGLPDMILEWKNKYQEIFHDRDRLKERIESLTASLSTSEMSVVGLKSQLETVQNELRDCRKEKEGLLPLEGLLQRESEKNIALTSEIHELRISLAEAITDLSLCRDKEKELVVFVDSLTGKNAALQNSLTSLQDHVSSLQSDVSSLSALNTNLREEEESLTARISSLEADARENEASIRKIEKEKGELELKLSEMESQIRGLKKKHAAAIKDLSRELAACQGMLKSNPNNIACKKEPVTVSRQGAGDSMVSRRTLVSRDDEDVLKVEPSADPSLPSQEVLIRKVVRLQQALVRRREKMEVLEEHRKQLIHELGKKTRVIQHYVLGKQSDALTSAEADNIKTQIAQKCGIMASIYSSKSTDSTMTLDLSLEINRRLQAVLEDTLLKNITLKENLHTMGEEVAKLLNQQRSPASL